MVDLIQKQLLEEIADLHDVPAGAYNIRANSELAGRNTTENIDIVSSFVRRNRYPVHLNPKESQRNQISVRTSSINEFTLIITISRGLKMRSGIEWSPNPADAIIKCSSESIFFPTPNFGKT